MEVRGSSGKSGGGGGGGNRRTRVGRDVGGEGDRDQEGGEKLAEGGGPGEGSFRGGEADRRSHVAGGGPDPQGERGLPRYRPCRGDVEISGDGS